MQTIPRIIHQTWKTRDIPARWKSLQQTWPELHPGWEYRFWTDEDNRAFIRQYYAWFLPIYDAYPIGISRADSFRYFLVDHFGGVYVDLDFECVRPLEELLEGKELVLGREPPEHAASPSVRARGLDRIIGNAFLASVPGHPFWQYVFQDLVEFQNAPVLDAASVFLLTRAYNRYPNQERLSVVASELLYPITKEEAQSGRLTPQQIRALFSDKAFAIHYWHGSWWREAVLKAAHQRVKHSPQ